MGKNTSRCGKASKTACEKNTAGLPECENCTLVKRIYRNWKMINRIPHKKCLTCGEWLTLDNFYHNIRIKNGHEYDRWDSYCKKCRVKRQREYDEEKKNRISYTV